MSNAVTARMKPLATSNLSLHRVSDDQDLTGPIKVKINRPTDSSPLFSERASFGIHSTDRLHSSRELPEGLIMTGSAYESQEIKLDP